MAVPHAAQYIRFFGGAIDGKVLKKVPVMADPEKPPIVIASFCGHAAHGMNRLTHLWERVTPLTQLYCDNGGGIVFDPEYGAMSSKQQRYHEDAFDQIGDFVELAMEDGTIGKGAVLKAYVTYDVPCKVVSRLGWTPEEFVRSSIRAKTALKDFHPCGVTFKVGLLYFLGPPIHGSGLTWYAPRCDMARYLDDYRDGVAVTPSSDPATVA